MEFRGDDTLRANTTSKFSDEDQISPEEVFIPANAKHTVSNVGRTNNFWYY